MSAPRLLAPTTISGGIPTAGAGTANTIALWTPDNFTLGNSLLTQAGNIVTNASGAIRATGTSQTSPAFMRHDATTSGIYFPATNEIGFTISNQHAMFISSGRNVGIGTTSPGSIVDVLRTANSTTNLQVRNLSATAAAQARLDIVSDAGTLVAGMVSSTWTSAGLANGDGYIWNLANRSLSFGTNSAERARIDSAGNFGVATSTMVAPGLTVTDPTNVNNIARANLRNNNSDVGNRIATVGYNGNTIQLFTASESTGTANNTLAFFAYNLTSFYTGTTVSNPQERMRINSSGNVGIGTASPGYRLHVEDTNLTPGYIKRNATASTGPALILDGAGGFSNNYAGLQLRSNNVSIAQIIQETSGSVYFDYNMNSASGALIIRSGGGTERARIDSAGRLGIGLSPSAFILETATDASIYGVRVGRGAGAVSSNTVVGNAALNANTTGTSNTAVGNFAANAVTTGASNTSIGFQANALLQGGSRNTAVGESAGYAALSSTDNTAIGRYAAVYNTGNNNVAVGAAALNGTLGSSTGSNNVAVGYQAGYSSTTGAGNIFIGQQAGYGVTTGQDNTYVGNMAATGSTTAASGNTSLGSYAMANITTGGTNTAVGAYAGYRHAANTAVAYVGYAAGRYQTGGLNVALGYQALLGVDAASSGAANTAIGTESLLAITTGANNTSVGYRSGYATTIGSQNTAVGHGSLVAVTSGSNNTALGLDSGNNITTGSSNICLGRASATAAAADSNQLVIGSTGHWVATPTAATYHATAGASLGYIQVRLNGANVKIQVFAP